MENEPLAQNKFNTELYTEGQLDCIENHIEKYFGKYDNVFHEIVSPDIHVDICIIAPTEERNYYTLVTMGMGAHRMNVPENLKDEKLDRAELLIKLPADWEIHGKGEEWYWPLRWLKVMARLPIEYDTWLGWGHTVPNGEPFAENTKLCCMLLEYPYTFGDDSMTCELPDGEYVRFYQMLPLYNEEAEFKVNNGCGALMDRFDDDFSDVLDINRKNYCEWKPVDKKWAIRNEDMRDLIEWDGAAGCIATDRILVDGCKVGYMYREEPDPESDMPDSGWRFTAGDESDEYMDDPDNSGIYHLNTICNYDPEIIPLLNAEYGSAYIRDEDGKLQLDEEWEDSDE